MSKIYKLFQTFKSKNTTFLEVSLYTHLEFMSLDFMAVSAKKGGDLTEKPPTTSRI